jgi:hypothetical protein
MLEWAMGKLVIIEWGGQPVFSLNYWWLLNMKMCKQYSEFSAWNMVPVLDVQF